MEKSQKINEKKSFEKVGFSQLIRFSNHGYPLSQKRPILAIISMLKTSKKR